MRQAVNILDEDGSGEITMEEFKSRDRRRNLLDTASADARPIQAGWLARSRRAIERALISALFGSNGRPSARSPIVWATRAALTESRAARGCTSKSRMQTPKPSRLLRAPSW